MAKIKGAVVVNNERCKGCELCVVACPADVLALQPKEVNDKGYHYAYMKIPIIVSDVPVAVMFVPTDVLPYIK